MCVCASMTWQGRVSPHRKLTLDRLDVIGQCEQVLGTNYLNDSRQLVMRQKEQGILISLPLTFFFLL